LAASCALLGFLPQYRIEGRRYSDGGLLCGLPIAAAAARGATRIVVVNCLPRMPAPVRGALRLLRKVTHTEGTQSGAAELITIAPSRPLGSLKDAACWKRENALRWIEQGRRDAEAALRPAGIQESPKATAPTTG
jgi:predicted acylesterase/phospholipase RssA